MTPLTDAADRISVTPARPARSRNAPSRTCWPIRGSGSGPGPRRCWSRPWPRAATGSALARPPRSGRSTTCPDGSTRPPGPSCSWAPSAPPPRQPARRGWPGTASWRAGSWRAARAPGRCPRSSSGWCSGPGPRACFRVPAAAAANAAGLGYLSGHAGVAVALGAAALPRLGPGGRALTLAAVPVVGLTRIYVGAHLPLDVAGGAALGRRHRRDAQPGQCRHAGRTGTTVSRTPEDGPASCLLMQLRSADTAAVVGWDSCCGLRRRSLSRLLKHAEEPAPPPLARSPSPSGRAPSRSATPPGPSPGWRWGG